MTGENDGAGAGNPGADAGGGASGADNKEVIVNNGGADPNAGKGADPNAGKGADPNAGKGADPNAGKGADPAKAPPGWTEQNWREQYAGTDAAKLNVLKRYPSLKEALDASFTARSELSKLLATQAPGKDATPEAVKAWRTAQGVPDAPEKYLETLPKELTFSEGDKPGIMAYLKDAHERGERPEVVSRNLKIYKDAENAAIQAMHTNDSNSKAQLESTLKKEWGGEYDANMGIFKNFLSTAPSDIREHINHMRMGDGSAAMLNASFVRWMTQNARAVNPMNINTGGAGMDTLESVEGQIATYEKQMRTDSKGWYKDEKAQAHYRQLLTYRDNNKAKGGRKTG